MKLIIFGAGNTLMRDDGFGVAVAHALADVTLPDGVEVIDGGAAALAVEGLLQEADHVILVDAAEMGKPPGTLVRFDPDQARNAAPDRPLSLHQGDLLSTLRLLDALGQRPPVTIIAVQPQDVSVGQGLSPPVEPAVAEAVRMVVETSGEIMQT